MSNSFLSHLANVLAVRLGLRAGTCLMAAVCAARSIGVSEYRSIGGVSAEDRRRIGGASAEYRRSIGGVSAEYRRSIGGVSAEYQGRTYSTIRGN